MADNKATPGAGVGAPTRPMPAVHVPANEQPMQAGPGATTSPAGPNTNPAMLDTPTTTQSITPADNDTNPTMVSGLGGGVTAPPRQDGQPQTTIDTRRTTINPDSSILNPVEPTGQPAPLKAAVVGKKDAQVSNKAKADDKHDAKKK